MRSKNHQLLKQVTTKALLSLSITYKSGDKKAFFEKISTSLNHFDNEVFKGFSNLKSLILIDDEVSPCSMEAVLEDDDGNEVIWSACYVSETGSRQGPYRLKGGLVVSRVNIEKSVDLTF